MGNTSTQKVLISVASEPAYASSSASATVSLTLRSRDGKPLKSLTHAQAYYWRQLCGAISERGVEGMADDEWPADLLPLKPTLTAMVEYGVIARRGRAWHLRRGWNRRLTELRLHAVESAPLSPAERPGPGLPSYSELEQWETLCRWLDGQSKRRARLPFAEFARFVGQPGIPAAASDLTELPVSQLLAMRRARIVRHTSSCEWALSPTWKERLKALWDGIARTERERFASQPSPADPRLLAAGIDTWYLNRLESEALPARLRCQLDDLQARANEDDEEIDTPWSYDGVPLRMYRAGVHTAQGGGVSWSYILRNLALTLLIRKHPLGTVIAQARLGSECLWRLTDVRALNELDALVRRMWGHGGKTGGQWQVSQVHLAVDVANAPIEAEQLSRYVSRSRRQAIYDAARSEVERLTRDLYGEVGQRDGEELQFTVDWDAEFADDEDANAFLASDPFGAEDGEYMHGGAYHVIESEPVPLEDRAVTLFRTNQRLSGVTWSPGGAISLVQYNKRLQGMVSGKRHMEPIWKASQGGWEAEEGATRFEVRMRREAIRELGLPTELRSCLDDPWEFLDHKQDVFAAVVGQLDGCPDGTNTAWIRLTVPDEHQSNRSRWPTDPLWRLVQSAPFSPAPASARRLIRRKHQLHAVERLDTGVYGYLVSRTAHLHPNGGQYDVSMALGESHQALQHEAAKPGKDFGELVRERRRRFGLPNPPAEKVLPFRRGMVGVAHIEAPRDAFPAEDRYPNVLADNEATAEHWALLLRAAEQRLEHALQALDEAASHQASPQRLQALDQGYLDALAAYQTAYANAHSPHNGS